MANAKKASKAKVEPVVKTTASGVTISKVESISEPEVKGTKLLLPPITEKIKLEEKEAYDKYTKPGKVRTGKMVDGVMVYDEEKPDEGEAPMKPTAKKNKVEDKHQKRREEKDEKTVVEGPKAKQYIAPPAHERKVAPPPKKGDTIITVKDLINEFPHMDGKKIRRIIRSMGYKAAETENKGMGPQTKYEWAEGGKVIAAIRKALIADGED